MIDSIKLIRNIGRFASVSSGNSLSFKRLTLIYAENGRGKTTLAAILRSLATGDPTAIIERKRLGAENPPHAVIRLNDGPRDLVFQNGQWNGQLPNLVAFDDAFVDQNVCSGLAVESSHRKNLHELVIGRRGVGLSDRIQSLATRIEEHNKKLRYRDTQIPMQVRDGLTVGHFCALPNRVNVDAEIQEKKRALAAIRKQQDVLTKPLLAKIELSALNADTFDDVLMKNLPNLETEAADRVRQHMAALGEGGERWISDGVKRLSFPSPSDTCPFCAQNLDGLSLIAHYRAYFSQAYDDLKGRVSRLLSEVGTMYGNVAQADFERSVRFNVEQHHFWSEFCEIPEIAIDTAAITYAWTAAGKAITKHLEAKQAAPLDQMTLDQRTRDAIAAYNAYRQGIMTVNERINDSNEMIRQVRERVKEGNPNSISSELSRLQAIKARYSPEIAPLCDDYLAEKRAKSRTEAERDQAKADLEEYRKSIFPRYRGGVNDYLEKFNTGFRLETFTPRNTGRGPTSNYNLEINDILVPVAGGEPSPGEPSFGNTLSAGDRNTIALAFFLESLDQHYSIGDTIVVIDDPISSLDEHRSWATEREVRRLVDSAGQVIVLSHNKQFLCRIWEGVDRNSRTALEIVRDSNGSTLCEWSVNDDLITEHDRRDKLLRAYVSSGPHNKKEVARSIRPHLEGFLRVAYPEHFPAGTLLGAFVTKCEQHLNDGDEILENHRVQDLDDIKEYANRFHHDTNHAWESEVINDGELLGFVKRTLQFVKP